MKTQSELISLPAPRSRRRHSPEFKARVIEACLQPGVSVTAVAVANQLNPNFVRKWIKAHREQEPLHRNGSPHGNHATTGHAQKPSTFVPATVPSSSAESSSDIRIEIRRQQTVVQIAWPVTQSSACAQWLRELLR